MDKHNMIGANFENLSQRYLYSVLATFPSFVFNKQCGVDEVSQRHSYEYMYNAIQSIYHNPALIDMPEYPDRYDGQGDRDEFLREYHSVESKFVWFAELLAMIGKTGTLEKDVLFIPQSLKMKKSIGILESIGLTVKEARDNQYAVHCEEYPRMFSAWKKLAAREGIGQTKYCRDFICNLYDDDHAQTALMLFEPLLEDGEALALIDTYCAEHGFSLSNGKGRYMIAEWLKKHPRQKRSRVQINFFWGKQNQIYINVLLPEIQEILTRFDTYDDSLRKTLVDITMKCNGCQFCLQTDKTKEKDIANQKIVYDGTSYSICTLFPIASMHSISFQTAKDLTRLFDYADGLMTK